MTDGDTHPADHSPLQRTQWRTWEDVIAVFEGPSDGDWAKDRDLVDHGVSDVRIGEPLVIVNEVDGATKIGSSPDVVTAIQEIEP